MGNVNARVFKVCRSLKKSKKGSPENGDDDSTLTDSAIVLRNRDKYFSKADYDKIMEKYPSFKEWIDESLNPQAKDRPKQKKIRFREAEVIGLGSYGRVIMGLNVDNGCLMATKQVQLGNGNNPPAQQEKVKSLKMEIALLSRFSHKNIVRYYGAQKNKNTFNIFLEYVSGGTIASLLDKYGPFNENLIRLYIRQILEGLEYLHVRNTIHRDIKGANILVDNNGVCKLADFGTATKISGLLETDANPVASLKGTVRWMAPEVIKQNNLGRFCDIWSVGCTLIEMATAQPPWHNVIKANSNSISTLYQIAQAKSPPPFPKGLSPEAIDFLKQCFKINPQERANVIKLLQHKFVSGIESPYNSFSKDPNSQQANSKPTMKPIQTKFMAQADINPNQSFKAAYTEVTPKVFSRLQSMASPTVKSPALKINQESIPKDKMVELENDKKHKESFSIKTKDQDGETEAQSGFPSKKISTEDKLSNSNASIKSQKGKIPKASGKKYLVQTDGPESKNEKTEDDENAKDKSKTGTVLLDLRENTKITIVARPLGQSPKTEKEYSKARKNKLSEINCFLEGESDYSSEHAKNESEEESAPVDTKAVKHQIPQGQTNGPAFKRSTSREIIPEIQEENDGVNSKPDLKRSQEKKKQHQMKIHIPRKDEDDSDSNDSDCDPSLANSSVLKPSGHAHVMDNGSFSTHNIEGRNMRINVHDQSSRLSIRRDTSFDTKRDRPEVTSEHRVRATRTKSEVIKPEMMSMSAKKADEKPAALASSMSKKDDKGNKTHGNWSLMNPDNEGKKLKKKPEKEKITKKGTCDNEYLQNFNLLDDLNKVYGQLEATSPPIK